jgi:hypothetical protein
MFFFVWPSANDISPPAAALDRHRTAQESAAFTEGVATVQRVELDLGRAQFLIFRAPPAALVTFKFDAPPLRNISTTQRITLPPGEELEDWRRIDAAFPVGAAVPVRYDPAQPRRAGRYRSSTSRHRDRAGRRRAARDGLWSGAGRVRVDGRPEVA